MYWYLRRLHRPRHGDRTMAPVDLLFSRRPLATGSPLGACPAWTSRSRSILQIHQRPGQSSLDMIARLRKLVIRRRVDQDANVELLRGALRRTVIHPEHDARDLLAAGSAKFDALADAADNAPRARASGLAPW